MLPICPTGEIGFLNDGFQYYQPVTLGGLVLARSYDHCYEGSNG